MDYRRTNAPQNTETRDVMKLAEPVGNVYEMVRIISKRANQLSVEMKQDLDTKLQEFASYTDNLEEVFENHEQIEISRFYETTCFRESKPCFCCSRRSVCWWLR